MHLESLTLRGFKSFASSTTLRFEPGITCVVGPNGSGKSNVVDALTWVMGEQGAKSLRGAKMDDVIFAGTVGSAGRPALGRAEVVLTIDNSDGALPIDYAEVRISRIMFAGGGSEYAINGSTCRLLDVAELLSDSGIGREMHVVVGQGRLDSVLSATPEERRGFIEEAAGVLKHRKRKEKALRKLEAMGANLSRLQDLSAELRRQLGPLGRQAEVARRAAAVQAAVRDARARLAADDLLRLRGELAAEIADETALRERRDGVERELAMTLAHERDLEARRGELAPLLARAQDTWHSLSALRERLRGTLALATERRRHLDEDVPLLAAGAPEEREREAAALRRQEAEVIARLDADRRLLADVLARRTQAEAAVAAEESKRQALLRAAADRREGLARLAGEVAALRSRASAASAELGRLQAAATEARARRDEARSAFAALESTVADLDSGEVDLDEEHEAAAGEQAQAEESVRRLEEEERTIERERAVLAARLEALERTLAPRDGAEVLLAERTGCPGLLGQVSGLVTVEAGAASAVAAALGAAAEAVAVDGLASAVAALERLRADDAGRAALLVADAGPVSGQRSGQSTEEPWPPLPDGARYAVDLLVAPQRLGPSLRVLLDRVAVVEDLAAARDLVAALPLVRAVTRTGDLLGTTFAVGGSAAAPSTLETQAAREDAQQRLTEAVRRAERLRFATATATAQAQSARNRADAALERLHESDARLSAVAEQLGQLGSTARSATQECERLDVAVSRAEQTSERSGAELAALEQRLAAAQVAPEEPVEPPTGDLDRLSALAAATRAEELDVRLAVRTAEERARALGAGAAGLERAADRERQAREHARAARERRARQATVAAAVAAGAAYALDRLEGSLRRAAEARAERETIGAAVETELLALRGRGRELASELEELTDSVHRDEVARAQQRLRVETLEDRVREELGLDPSVLVVEFGPHQPVPLDGGLEAGEEVYDRARQEHRLRSAERSLTALGKVNPLALEEYAALEERQAFLTEALRDLQASRRDLLEIVREVDERVQRVFAEAYRDAAREFEGVFARLFPGGEGRLVLTDPEDMLATGIDVEARPAGKKVKRLSLLSGGERSLAAVALLVAIFKARPSPFYVLDEVEAALDDTNLGRLLTLFEELRESSQLLIITHQKRTMEIADALYGVSMRGDGVSSVISQRLRERVSA